MLDSRLNYSIDKLDLFFKSLEFKAMKKYWFKELENSFIIYFKLRRRTDFVENFFVDYGFFIKKINNNKNKIGNNDYGCEAPLNFFRLNDYRSGIKLDQEECQLNIDIEELTGFIMNESLPLLYKVANKNFLESNLPKEDKWEEGNPYLEFNFDWQTHARMLEFINPR